LEKPKRYSLFFRKAALLLLPVYAVWFLFVEFMPDFLQRTQQHALVGSCTQF
jgi:hypothetical protein